MTNEVAPVWLSACRPAFSGAEVAAAGRGGGRPTGSEKRGQELCTPAPGHWPHATGCIPSEFTLKVVLVLQ